MPQRVIVVFVALAAVCAPALAQNSGNWTFSHRLELKGDYRWSEHERHPLRFLFPPEFLPPGATMGFLETPDAGSHVELNNIELQLDLKRGDFFTAHAKVHGEGLHRRNPTSSDRKIDADELYVRFGPNPDFLERPEHTSFFVQAGKAPKMERQPIRLLESYGLAATSFNRFEDVQLLTGGSIGRNLYWRLQASNGNPVFFRDPNALAGDNGTPEMRRPFPNPDIKSGFPIIYNAETESLFFSTDHVQLGEGLGYRWQRADETLGFDLIAFHYRRSLATEEELTGTFYGGDLDLLDGAFGIGLPITSRVKEEYGARLYSEWHAATLIAQFTKQNVAGLQRQGWEIETGYRFGRPFWLIESIQPAIRASGLTNRFLAPPTFVAPSMRWPWTKFDAGIRIGFRHRIDLTVETTRHNVGSRFKLHLRETMATVRWRL